MPDGGLWDFFSGGSGFAEPPATQAAPDLMDFPASGPGSNVPDYMSTTSMTGPQGGPGNYPGESGGMDWGKYIPAAIAGGTGLLSYFTGQGGAADKALKAQAQSTKGIAGTANQQLADYNAGKVGAPNEAQLELYRKQRMAQLEQQAANSGIPVGSMESDFRATVDREVMGMRQNMLQQEYQNAFAGTGMSTTNLTNLARQQAIQDEQQRAAFAEFMKELGKIGGDIFGQGGILS